MSTPMRVVVAGSSTASYVSPPRSVRSDGAYPELLGAALERRGIAADVRIRSKWLGLVSDLRREYEQVVRDAAPDVLVLAFGIVDCQPNMLPTWLARHLANWNRGGALAARAYRRFVTDRLWPMFRAYQQRLAGLPTYRVTPRAFRAELTRVVALARLETRALVLVLDLDPVGDRLEYWMPSMRRRRERYQELVQEVVDRFGPDVRLVSASVGIGDRVAELLPDGLHRSADAHRELAEVLAEEIAAWSHETDGPDKDDPVRWV